MKYVSGGELLVDCLRGHGVRHVFSIIGGQMGSMFDTIGRREDMDLILPRCETAAPIMAAGYTASSGLPAASMSTVGAGAVYEVGGLACSWLNYLPVVSISPQVQSWKTKPHQESLQACNQDEIFMPVTKWNSIVYHWERIPQMVARGFREAHTGIPGPVHLDVPVDILFKRHLAGRRRRERLTQGNIPFHSLPGDKAGLQEAAKYLHRSSRPLVLLGQGFGRKGRFPQIRNLLERLGIPVLSTRFSAGAMSGEQQGLSSQALLFTESREGRDLVHRADTVLVLGTDPESAQILASCPGEGDRNVIQIETEPSAFRPGVNCRLQADPANALQYFLQSTAGLAKKIQDWQDEFVATRKACESSGSSAREVLHRLLEQDAADNTIVVADGTSAMRAVSGPDGNKDMFFLDQKDMLGAGLPFAMGAALSNPQSDVILVCDENSLFAHIRELAQAEELGAGIRIMVINEGDGAQNCLDTARVLEGLGFATSREADVLFAYPS